MAMVHYLRGSGTKSFDQDEQRHNELRVNVEEAHTEASSMTRFPSKFQLSLEYNPSLSNYAADTLNQRVYFISIT